MSPFTQAEHLLGAVDDSVMTRTMDGIIHFWNRSAEKLYGWRKEEAIGKVSHKLLQTQFPKALEEIESDLVRNGRWEGKLVHTTRDGGQVVVESRWTLDPKGQGEAVVEINTPAAARTGEVTIEGKQSQNPLGQAPWQQPESYFELVNDSVMTRSMEGKISFWNRSAEKLYGWRKEEAIGKVSHKLLQTQFPKALKEIESELVRNGRWEGKLVHTTRDGGQVVVESRWTLDPEVQDGSVIEVNTRSTDRQMGSMTRADTGRASKDLPAAATKAEALLEKLANVFLVASGLYFTLLLFYVLYQYGWTAERRFLDARGIVLYGIFPAILAGLLFYSLKLQASYKIKLTVALFSTAVSIYSVEVAISLWSSLPSVQAERVLHERAKAAQRMGSDFDMRTRLEVITDLRKRAIDAYPAIPTSHLMQNVVGGRLRSKTGGDLWPLGGISNKVSVLCNEGGDYTIYESDDHGFHNPKGIWKMGKIDVAAVGDSYTQGMCVPSEKNFVALIREQYPLTLNLGFSGNGPLTKLATIEEYLPSLRPKVVLWFYHEGTDPKDLKREMNSPLLMRYLNGAFSQRLLARQGEIDRTLAAYVEDEMKKSTLSRITEEIAEEARNTDLLWNIVKLGEVRQRLGLYGGFDWVSKEHGEAEFWEVEDLFRRVLLQAKATVDEWEGTFYFVYLPDWRTNWESSRKDREAVMSLVNQLEIPIIDVQRTFQLHSDPFSLFPLRRAGHYNVEGHRLVADEVLRSISAREPSS